MALLVPTRVGRLSELHGRVVQTFRCTLTAAGTFDHVVTGLVKLEAIVGWCFIGTPPTQAGAATLEVPGFALNSNNGTEDTLAGSFAVRTAAATDYTIDVTVVGLLQA